MSAQDAHGLGVSVARNRAREYQVWLQSGLSGNPPSSIHIGAGMPPPLRRIQVEELPAPVEVSFAVAESLALAPLPASPAGVSTLVHLTPHSAATGGLGACCMPTKETGSPAVVEPVFVAGASPLPVAVAAAAAAAAVAAPRKRRACLFLRLKT